VNNAVHWAIVEETLPDGPRRGRGEVEYLAPVDREVPLELVTSADPTGRRDCWLVADGVVLTAARWTPAE
jgi:hypothetical protein